ncbi:ParB/RepB/Spo0J family partition protein [Emergencia sp. 1XD21-10]|uniref:ParB/RepB/Spo0J family partition protein n=1 Tax=Emergencia sp. 1XD21-10 TaxID=2304569 RepID=UPI00137986DC|nr:ParB/RepB/Spo0J family partition protein [Emergencia sp. 1XD21-10]NCF00650.1 ParB/RepB/Spo0J family partition protein [Emergencia sp. 1XD21-10]
MGRRNEFDPSALESLFPEAAKDKKEEGSSVTDILLDDILPFHTGGSHPFEVVDDDDMHNLEDDIRENGQLEPIIVRKDVNLTGRYEAITGHRRMFVARKLGLDKIKATIVDYNDEQATRLMVVSNLQKRSVIKPSTKAKAYALYMEVNKRQGERADLTSCPLGTKLRTDDQAAEEFQESARNIQRYIRLNELILPLLGMVDAKEIKFRVGVELSYLDKKDQKNLLEYMQETGYMPSLEEATEIKKHYKNGGTVDAVYLDQLTGRDSKVTGAETELKAPKAKKLKINERFVTEYLPEPMRKLNVERKRAYTQAALIMYNNYLAEHPEEQKEWED